jgi:hypothetical protein
VGHYSLLFGVDRRKRPVAGSADLNIAMQQGSEQNKVEDDDKVFCFC